MDQLSTESKMQLNRPSCWNNFPDKVSTSQNNEIHPKEYLPSPTEKLVIQSIGDTLPELMAESVEQYFASFELTIEQKPAAQRDLFDIKTTPSKKDVKKPYPVPRIIARSYEKKRQAFAALGKNAKVTANPKK